MNAEAVANDADVAPDDGLPPLPPPVPQFNPMDVALTYIGFDTPVVRAHLRAEGLMTFSDLKSLKEKDIRDIAESFSKRTVNDGRYLFGIWRTRLLIGLIHARLKWNSQTLLAKPPTPENLKMRENGQNGNLHLLTIFPPFKVSMLSHSLMLFETRQLLKLILCTKASMSRPSLAHHSKVQSSKPMQERFTNYLKASCNQRWLSSG